MSLSSVNKIIDSVFPQISTNFTLSEMIGYAKDFMKYKLGETMGFPEDNTTDMLNEVGSVVIPNTLSSNVLKLHQFLFGIVCNQSDIHRSFPLPSVSIF